MSLFLVLLNQHGQLRAEAAVADVAAALLVVALEPRQPSTVAVFEQHRLSGVHTLPAEVLADQVSHLDSIMVVIACLPCGRRDSPAQSVGPPGRMSPGPLQLLGSQTEPAQLQPGAVLQIRGFRPRQIVSQIA